MTSSQWIAERFPHERGQRATQRKDMAARKAYRRARPPTSWSSPKNARKRHDSVAAQVESAFLNAHIEKPPKRPDMPTLKTLAPFCGLPLAVIVLTGCASSSANPFNPANLPGFVPGLPKGLSVPTYTQWVRSGRLRFTGLMRRAPITASRTSAVIPPSHQLRGTKEYSDLQCRLERQTGVDGRALFGRAQNGAAWVDGER